MFYCVDRYARFRVSLETLVRQGWQGDGPHLQKNPRIVCKLYAAQIETKGRHTGAPEFSKCHNGGRARNRHVTSGGKRRTRGSMYAGIRVSKELLWYQSEVRLIDRDPKSAMLIYYL